MPKIGSDEKEESVTQSENNILSDLILISIL